MSFLVIFQYLKQNKLFKQIQYILNIEHIYKTCKEELGSGVTGRLVLLQLVGRFYPFEAQRYIADICMWYRVNWKYENLYMFTLKC